MRTSSVSDFGLGTQAWLGQTQFDPLRIAGGPWPTQPCTKPPRGFFTSTWDAEQQTSAWREFKATTPRASEPRKVILLHPEPTAILYVVDCAEDYEKLVEAYPHPYDNPARQACPHWGRLAQETALDGIHVTADVTADPRCPCAHSWQVESTLWLRPTLKVVL